jgi:sarcosine oxidase subunit alpha
MLEAKAGERIEISVDGRKLRVEAGLTLAAALWNAGIPHLRYSVSGEPRGALCAMGICYECRVTIDGAPHRRACLELCRAGMEVATADSDDSGDSKASDA